MSSMEEVEAAEAKMNAANDALLNNIETGKAIDRMAAGRSTEEASS